MLVIYSCASPERSWGPCSKGTGSSCPGSSCSWISPKRHCPSTLKPTTLEDTTSKSKVGEEGFRVCQNLANPVTTFHQQLADMWCFSPNIVSGLVSSKCVRKSSSKVALIIRDTERITEERVKSGRLLCFDEALCLVFAKSDSDVEYLPPEDDDRLPSDSAPVINGVVHEAVH